MWSAGHAVCVGPTGPAEHAWHARRPASLHLNASCLPAPLELGAESGAPPYPPLSSSSNPSPLVPTVWCARCGARCAGRPSWQPEFFGEGTCILCAPFLHSDAPCCPSKVTSLVQVPAGGGGGGYKHRWFGGVGAACEEIVIMLEVFLSFHKAGSISLLLKGRSFLSQPEVHTGINCLNWAGVRRGRPLSACQCLSICSNCCQIF